MLTSKQIFVSLIFLDIQENQFNQCIRRGSLRVDRALALGDLYVGPDANVVAYLEPKSYDACVDLGNIPLDLDHEWKPKWKLIRHISPGFLLVDKPAGISSIINKDHAQGALVPFWLRKNLPRTLGVGTLLTTSRLDVGTHGLIVVGRSSHYVSQYNSLIATRKITKKYTAVVSGWKPQGSKPPMQGWTTTSRKFRRDLGLWEHWTSKRSSSNSNLDGLADIAPGEWVISDKRQKERDHLIVIAHHTRSEQFSVPLQMIIERVRRAQITSVACRPFNPEWLEKTMASSHQLGDPFYEIDIELLTGKTHQIRAQLHAEGLVILGDWLYGSEYIPKPNTFALCCRKLSWICPEESCLMEFDLRSEDL